MGHGNTFKKTERLSLNKRIELLFSSGAAISLHPVKIVYLPFSEPLEFPVQVLFTVSSKRFKSAVVRNRIKRKLKEIYRMRKPSLYEELGKQKRKLLIGILYTGNDPDPKFEDLDNTVGKGLEMLIGACRSAGW
jgi:ribonuclease P protein component